MGMENENLVARAHRLVSVAEFANAGSPIELGHLDLTAPAERQYFLRMAIRAEGSNIALPDELLWIKPLLDAALAHQTEIGTDHPFCYVTIRHGEVTSQTDDEWHVDGFSTKVAHVPEQNYIWASADATEYAPDLKVVFPEDFDPRIHNVNPMLAAHVGEVRECEPKTIYCLDPYLLHRRPSKTTNTHRTFVRISFVPIEINDINNSQNPLLPRTYDHDGVAFREKLTVY